MKGTQPEKCGKCTIPPGKANDQGDKITSTGVYAAPKPQTETKVSGKKSDVSPKAGSAF